VTLSDAELKRYSRQLVLDGIGPVGQQKLKGARVSVVGIGGLGCVSATQLAAMGFGYLRLIDQDVVDLTNLHRQFLYDTDSLGYPKVEIAQKRLEALNPHIAVEASPMTVTRETAVDAVRGVDVVVDGLDHFAPRYAINEACVEKQIPYIYAGALGAYGNVSTLIPGVTPCLECLTGTMSDEGLPTCESVGVIPSVLSVIASIQVKDALNLLLGNPPLLANKLLFIDLNTLSFDTFETAKSQNCQTCGSSSTRATPTLTERRVTELCGNESFMISPGTPLDLNLDAAADVIGATHKINVRSKFGITLAYSADVTISLMKTGNALVKGVPHKRNALHVYDEIMRTLVPSR
jgi:adenylyltransferase/sulfurtransferase